ncbi:MAG TPA: nuclear transport factor 2 family protein [Puia sp.]|nr:nuclear transport factor 2 family protein [Puia sp.]
MKRASFITSFLLVYSVFVFGQSDDETSIRQILTDITNVNKTRDFIKLESIFADDFIFITAQGKTFNKTERIAFVKSVPPPDFFEYSKIQIRIYGKTAVLNTETNLIPRGKTAETHIVTIVMVKNSDRWQEVNVQATKKPEAQ